MDKVQAEKNTSNRRQALRIYEQVDLVFHKLEFNEEQLYNPEFNNTLSGTVKSFNCENELYDIDAVESQLPSSSSQKNETLNINISSTGISFTSKEELMPDDYLILRVLLLSSMIAITTCCKVVYTKPSNPHEKDQYPYTVGVRFVKLNASDKEVLAQYIRKKRLRLLGMNALLICFLFVFIQVPELFFEVATDLFSFVIDEFVGIVHLFYEIIEYGLDYIIEHIFHTDMQATQTLVFYLQNILMIGLSIPVFRLILEFCKSQVKQFQLFLYRKKSSVFYFWGGQTVLRKIGIVGFLVLLTSFFISCFI